MLAKDNATAAGTSRERLLTLPPVQVRITLNFVTGSHILTLVQTAQFRPCKYWDNLSMNLLCLYGGRKCYNSSPSMVENI